MNCSFRFGLYIVPALLLISLAPPLSAGNPRSTSSASISAVAFVSDPVGLIVIDDQPNHPSSLWLRLPRSGQAVTYSTGSAARSFRSDGTLLFPVQGTGLPGDTVTVICTEN